MFILTSASQKGGAGKTTLAAHLAVQAVRAKKKTVLIDTDPQGTLSQWWESREAENPTLLKTTIANLANDLDALKTHQYDVCVIDTPPGVGKEVQKVIEQSNFIVVPIKPSPNDLRAVGSTVELIRETGVPFGFVISMAKPRTNLNAQAIAALSEHGIVSTSIIHDRIGFAESMIDGRTVMEIDPKGKSSKEIQMLWKWIQQRTKNEEIAHAA
jgi:chromosome partitioning protein